MIISELLRRLYSILFTIFVMISHIIGSDCRYRQQCISLELHGRMRCILLVTNLVYITTIAPTSQRYLLDNPLSINHKYWLMNGNVVEKVAYIMERDTLLHFSLLQNFLWGIFEVAPCSVR